MTDQLKYRVRLTEKNRSRLFSEVTEKGYTIRALAVALTVNERTLREWRKGSYTMPMAHFEELARYSGRPPEDYAPEYMPEWWHTSSAGKVGGASYMDKHAALGTQDSRRQGGLNSYAKRSGPGDIYARKSIVKPPLSPELAEFIGIMIGDGSVGSYQISVTLDARTDVEYALYVGRLASRLFGIEVATTVREKQGCIVLTLSSVELSAYLVSLGLPRGNKVMQAVAMPQWVANDLGHATACVRGIFDTDGSVFQEVHKIKDARYSYPRAALVSASLPLLQDVHGVLCRLGVDAKVRSRRVSIERFTDIEKYFRIVGSSNPKHLRRYAQSGGVG